MKKDIQNLNTKKTSNTHIKVGVTEKIGLFSRRSRDVKCVLGGGHCVGHNVKLSKIENDGQVTCSMREVTLLTCPAVNHTVHKKW